jgi:MFS family permease
MNLASVRSWPVKSNPFSVLRHRDYAVFWTAAVTSDVGTWMQAVTVGVIVAAETGKASATGLVAAAAFLPQAIGAPVGGVIADRVDRRQLLRLLLAIQTVNTVVLAAIVASPHPSPGLMAALVLIQGFTNALGLPAMGSMLPELVPREELLSAVALQMISWNAGRILGPTLAGLIVLVANPSAVIWTNAVSFVVLLVAISLLRGSFSGRSPDDDGARRGFLAELAKGPTTMWRLPAVRVAWLSVAVTQTAGGPIAGLLPIVSHNVFHSGRGLTTVLTTTFGIGALVGATLSPGLVLWLGRTRTSVLTLIGTALCSMATVWAPERSLAVPVVFVFGLCFVAMNVAIGGVAHRDAPAHLRARVLSMFAAAYGLFFALGVIGMGRLADHVGLRTGFTIYALAVLALTGTAVVLARRPLTLLGNGDPTSTWALRRETRQNG